MIWAALGGGIVNVGEDSAVGLETVMKGWV